MLEECGNKKHNDNNENERYASMDTMNKWKYTCPGITYPSMMEEYRNNKTMISMIMKQMLVWIS